MIKKQKVLFVVNGHGSWIERDRNLLLSEFIVSEVFLKPGRYLYLNSTIIKKIFWSDVLFFWFGSLQFLPLIFIAKLLRKKIVIVSGGYDVAKGELINHGAYCERPLKQKLRTWLFSMADKVLAVSKVNRSEAIKNAHVPESKVDLVYLGFSEPNESLIPWTERPKKIVMLAAARTATFKLKGIEHFLEIARVTPEYEFVLMGAYDELLVEHLEKEPVKNLRVTGFIPFGSETFKSELRSSRFVFQLSYYESFCAAVVDAGLFGCYPVVFGQFALAEIVDGIGKCFPYGDREAICKFIRNEGLLLQVDENQISQAFISRFPVNRRKELLVKTIESLA